MPLASTLFSILGFLSIIGLGYAIISGKERMPEKKGPDVFIFAIIMGIVWIICGVIIQRSFNPFEESVFPCNLLAPFGVATLFLLVVFLAALVWATMVDRNSPFSSETTRSSCDDYGSSDPSGDSWDGQHGSSADAPESEENWDWDEVTVTTPLPHVFPDQKEVRRDSDGELVATIRTPFPHLFPNQQEVRRVK